MTQKINFATPETGLTAAEVAERVAQGRANARRLRTSRTVGRDRPRQRLHALQRPAGRAVRPRADHRPLAERPVRPGRSSPTRRSASSRKLRAKRTLDRLAVLNAPTRARGARRRRGRGRGRRRRGSTTCSSCGRRPGARRRRRPVGDGLEIDESLLTGESEPVVKQPGDAVCPARSSWPGTGGLPDHGGRGGLLRRPAVAAEARRFTTTHSELVAGHRTGCCAGSRSCCSSSARPALEPVPHRRQRRLARRGHRHGRGAGRHDPRGTGAADQRGLHGRHRDPGAPADAGAGAAGGRGAGPGRRRLPGQDRHPHRTATSRSTAVLDPSTAPTRRLRRRSARCAARRTPNATAWRAVAAPSPRHEVDRGLRPCRSPRPASGRRSASTARHLGAGRAGDGAAATPTGRPRRASAADDLAAEGHAGAAAGLGAPTGLIGERRRSAAAPRPATRPRWWCWPSGSAPTPPRRCATSPTRAWPSR